MKLQKIKLKNWKCFSDKEVVFNDKTILKWPNGSGKSSLIEAILFALYSKRPNGLDSASLKLEPTQQTLVHLYFEHNHNQYVVEREFSSPSKHLLYKEGELIARTASDVKAIIDSVLPEHLCLNLWGHASLADSDVLKTDFLMELLEHEFEQPLAIKQRLTTTRSIVQKKIAALEKSITENVTEKDLEDISLKINNIEAALKARAFISDSEVAKAKLYASNHENYIKLKNRLSKLKQHYDRDVCVRLYSYGKTLNEWQLYFSNVEKELELEKLKTAHLHPLTNYPKNIVDKLLKESQGKCIICGSDCAPVSIDYSKIDLEKITKLENTLKDKQYDFNLFTESIAYLQAKKQLEQINYDESYDWKKVIENYNAETNAMYHELSVLKRTQSTVKATLDVMASIFEAKKEYDKIKSALAIIQEYIAATKSYFSTSLVNIASGILVKLNSRYERIYVEDGVYKVNLFDSKYQRNSTLAVQALSKGEKTLVSLSLVLAVVQLFSPNMLLVMDEAFSNLDAYNVEAVSSFIKGSHNQWVVVSHDERLEV